MAQQSNKFGGKMSSIERQILFNSEMVNAILCGRKTQTRRTLLTHNIRDIQLGAELGECHSLNHLTDADMSYVSAFCPFGQVGDLLYVRESFAIVGDPEKIPCSRKNIVYRADYPNCIDKSYDPDSIPNINEMRFTPSIHMPKWAARIHLQITNIRIEPVTQISVNDAIAEGIEPMGDGEYRDYDTKSAMSRNNPIHSFKTLWRETNGQWSESTYVWVIEFKVLTTFGQLEFAS